MGVEFFQLFWEMVIKFCPLISPIVINSILRWAILAFLNILGLVTGHFCKKKKKNSCLQSFLDLKIIIYCICRYAFFLFPVLFICAFSFSFFLLAITNNDFLSLYLQ